MRRVLAITAGFLTITLAVPNLIVLLLFDARQAGLQVTGFAADRRDYGRVMGTLRVREAAARVKTMADVVTGADPHFLGARIPIAGDGRVSWGPAS